MNYRYNVSCSETMSKNWTPSAVDCYKLGCVCARCNLYKIYFSNSNKYMYQILFPVKEKLKVLLYEI